MPYEPTGTLDHHFLEGRQYRAEELEEQHERKRAWRHAFYAAMSLLAVSLLWNFYQSTLPRRIPVPFEVDKASGVWRPLAELHTYPEPIEATRRLWVREFMTVLRRITEDKELTAQDWQRIRKRLTKSGRQWFLQYEKERKPLEQREPVRVEVLHIFKRTARTYDVRWQETLFNEKREAVKVLPYTGLVTLEQRAPRDDEMDDNPAGIFFDPPQWSKE